MKPSKLWPLFDVSVPAPSQVLVMSDSSTGFRYECNLTATALNLSDGKPAEPYCGRTIKQQNHLIPAKFAFDFESQFVRKSGSPAALSTSEGVDDVKSSHTTGGGRRRFISPAFAHHVRGLPDGLPTLKAWAKCQENRPVGHWPFTFTYDAYKGTCADGWTYDKLDLRGWGIFDPAHLDTSNLFAGAASGDQECLAHFLMLYAWVASTYPGAGPHCPKGAKLGWTGSQQARAYGWLPKADAQAALLGLDTADKPFLDTFLAGTGPKHHLLGRMQDMLVHQKPMAGAHPDSRTMPDISKSGYPNELLAEYGWGHGIMFHGLGYVFRTKLIADQALLSMIRTWVEERAAIVVERVVGPGGMSYAFSGNDWFDAAALAVANQVGASDGATDPTSLPLELIDPDGDGAGAISTKKRVSDSELMLGGLATLFDEKYPQCATLAGVCAKPTDPPGYQKIATYADVYYALAERSAVP